MHLNICIESLTLSKRQVVDSSKWKEFAYYYFKFDENDRKLSKRIENTTSNFYFSHGVFERPTLQTRKK